EGSGGSTGECEEYKERAGEKMLQPKAVTSEPGIAPPIVHEALNSPGQPLDKTMRDFFEPRFGCDLSTVRVHRDQKASESAQAVKAIAYTTGREVVFAEGKYAPGTPEGRRLLAHELAHFVQCNRPSDPNPLPTGLEVRGQLGRVPKLLRQAGSSTR